MNRSVQAAGQHSPQKSIRDFFTASSSSKSANFSATSTPSSRAYDHSILSGLSTVIDEPKHTNKKRASKTTLSPHSTPKKQKRIESEERQWSLDVGQKDTEECSECGMLYSLSSETDRESHRVYHRLKLGGVKIKITPSMNVVYTNPQNSTRQIILLSKQCESKSSIKSLLETVDRELHLNSWSESSRETEQIYIYIANGLGVGVIRTEAIKRAHRILASEPASDSSSSPSSTQESKLDTSVSSAATTMTTSSDVLLCSKEFEPATLGVSRVWVRSDYQRQRIASTLLDVARANFHFGSVIPKTSCAMTQPTNEGRQFATQYFETVSYLVYDHNEL